MKYEVLTDNIPYEELYLLMKDSFHEREEQGLNFTVIGYSLEDLKRALKGRTVVIAYEKNPHTEEREYIGFRQIVIKGKEAFGGVIAVSPKNKREGIGSRIEEIAEQVALESGCTFMTSDTSVDAISSVRWHLKNRYFKYKMRSSPSTNYYTVYFRKQLRKHWFWSVKGLRNLYYYVSVILCHIYRRKDGSLTGMGRVINLFRHISHV